MSCLADLEELVGSFSYSRDDDEDAKGALSALRERIQRELRGQLGRSMKTFRIWQDKEAIPAGTLWEAEIKTAIDQAVFFVPIITPTVVKSPFCKFELESFLERERALGRQDLVFPILYIRVPALEDSAQRQANPVLSIISKRQYVDWREFRIHKPAWRRGRRMSVRGARGAAGHRASSLHSAAPSRAQLSPGHPDQGLIHCFTKTELTAVVTRSLLPACVVLAGRNWLGCLEQNSSSHGYAKCRRPAAIHTLESPT